MNHLENPEWEQYFTKMADKDFWKKYYHDNFDL